METPNLQRLGISINLPVYSEIKRLIPYGAQERLFTKLIEDFTRELSVRGTKLCYDYLADHLNVGEYIREHYEKAL